MYEIDEKVRTGAREIMIEYEEGSNSRVYYGRC